MTQLALAVERPLVFVAMSVDGRPLAAVPVEEGETWQPAALWCYLAIKQDEARHGRPA